MNVLWTKNAIEHLAGIHDHIAVNSPAYAKRMVDKITRRSVQIADMVSVAWAKTRRLKWHADSSLPETFE